MARSSTAAVLSNCYVPLTASSSSNTKESLKERQARLLSSRSNGDGATRGPAALRRLCLETSVLSSSSSSSSSNNNSKPASALVELGHTKILAQVNGPLTDTITSTTTTSVINMDEGTLQCQVKFAPHIGVRQESVVGNAVTTLDSFQVSAGRMTSAIATREADLSSRLQAALLPAVPLQQYPKCLLSVQVTVLQDDGSVLSTAIVAAALALADANVELYDLVSSCTVAVFLASDENNNSNRQASFLADPTEDELSAADATVILAVMPNWKDVTLWQQSGKLSQDEASHAVDLCRDGCRTLQRFMRQCLVDDAVVPSSKQEGIRQS